MIWILVNCVQSMMLKICKVVLGINTTIWNRVEQCQISLLPFLAGLIITFLWLSKQYYTNDRMSVFQQHKLLLPRFRWSLSGMESLARQMVWHLARPSSLSRFASMLSIHLIMQSETEWEKARVRGRRRESEVRATQTVIDRGGRDTEMMFIWSMTQSGRISWHSESL